MNPTPEAPREGHTPGPLSVTERKPSHDCYGPHAIECLIHVGDGSNRGNAIASVGLGGPGGTWCLPEAVRANAHLFAAAPDLLAALEAAKHYFGPHVIRSCGTCENCGSTTPNGTLKICRRCVMETMEAALAKANPGNNEP